MSELNRSPKTPTEITKKYGVTYSHTVKVLYELLRLGFIHMEKKGRNTTYTLTKSGSEISSQCKVFIDTFNAYATEKQEKSHKDNFRMFKPEIS